MSADNWTVCPRCLHKALIEKEELKRQVNELYGKIAIVEFDDLRAQAEAPLEIKHTFREDYETGMHSIEEVEDLANVRGQFFVVYKGECQECGLRYEHRHEETFWDPLDPDDADDADDSAEERP